MMLSPKGKATFESQEAALSQLLLEIPVPTPEN
jgi:hypothetical protein